MPAPLTHNCLSQYDYLVMTLLLFESTSKSSTKSFVSSVPLRLPTAHTNLVSLPRMRHTTPPEPPLSKATRFLMNSPVRTSHSFTVPSSDDVITKRLLNCRQVTADWCLKGPGIGWEIKQWLIKIWEKCLKIV